MYEPNETRLIPELPTAIAEVIAGLRVEKRQREDTARGPQDDGWQIIRGRHAFIVRRAAAMRHAGVAADLLLSALMRLRDDRCAAPGGRKIEDAEVELIAGWTSDKVTDSGDDVGPVLIDAAPAGLRFYSPAEVAAMTLPEPDWIVRPGLLAIGAITDIDGKIKAAGKTTLALYLVRAVLEGAAFLGEPTRASQVLYVTEQSRQTFSDALRRAELATRGNELRILFREDIGRVPWPEVVAATRQDGYTVVVFDTLGKLSGIRDENAAADWAAAMTPLQDLAASGRAVLVARHDRKGGGDVGESGRGSSQASGDVDIILALRRPEGHQPSNRRVIESLSRYHETPEKIVVELVDGAYRMLGTDEAVALNDARAFVSAAIGREYRQTSAGLSVKALVELSADSGATVKRTTIQAVLDELIAAGGVSKSGRGVAGDPYLYSPAQGTSAVSAETQTYSGRQTLSEEIEGIFGGAG